MNSETIFHTGMRDMTLLNVRFGMFNIPLSMLCDHVISVVKGLPENRLLFKINRIFVIQDIPKSTVGANTVWICSCSFTL